MLYFRNTRLKTSLCDVRTCTASSIKINSLCEDFHLFIQSYIELYQQRGMQMSLSVRIWKFLIGWLIPSQMVQCVEIITLLQNHFIHPLLQKKHFFTGGRHRMFLLGLCCSLALVVCVGGQGAIDIHVHPHTMYGIKDKDTHCPKGGI